MTVVLQYPKDELTLRQISTPYDSGVLPSAELVDDMAKYKGRTQGLAAVQLGVPVRLIMVKYGEEYIFLLNPIIVGKSDQMYNAVEGCMSIGLGNTRFTISRHKIVKVRYTDLEGNQRSIKARNLDASCLQHEIDHLEGRLIID